MFIEEIEETVLSQQKLTHVVFSTELSWVINKLLNTTNNRYDIWTMNSTSNSLQTLATVIDKVISGIDVRQAGQKKSLHFFKRVHLLLQFSWIS